MKFKIIKLLAIVIFIISLVVFLTSHQFNYIASSAVIMLFSSIVIWYIIYTSQKNQMMIRAKTNELELLTDHIPCGVLKTRASQNHKMIYINDSFAKIMGCAPADLKNDYEHRPFHSLFDEESGTKINAVTSSLQHYSFDSKLKKANGEQIWVVVYGRIILDEKGEKTGIWVVFDNNEQKLSQEKIQIVARKYKILADYSESVIFEIDVKTGNAEFNDNFKKTTGQAHFIENFVTAVPDLDIFHPEDISVFTDALSEVTRNKKSVVAEVRMKYKDGSYLWQCGRIAPIIDDNGHVISIIGRISNIDKQKRETEHLLIKTTLDPLTSLNNKIATQTAIDDFLCCKDENSLSAMLAIDIDNFKCINDQWGHLFGDTVLTDIAILMKKLFREDDIIGRFGGDEFIVFLKDISSETFAANISEELLNLFNKTYSVGGVAHNFSASIGISFYSEHGETFSQLYEKADKALYHSKKNGKNQYCVFSDAMQEQIETLSYGAV